MNEQEPSEEDFYQAIIFNRLHYLRKLKLIGNQVDDAEIERLEKELAQAESQIHDAQLLSQTDLEALQYRLAFADFWSERSGKTFKLLLLRLRHTTVRMRREPNHKRAHFHVEYKREYEASYSIDTLEQLAGNLPSRYETPVLEWASERKKSLQLTWDRLQAGENVQELSIEVEEA